MNSCLYLWLFSATITLFAQNSLDRTASAFKIFDERDGLEVGDIHSLAYDQEGWLWLSGLESELGVSLFMNNVPKLQWFDGLNFHTVNIPTIPTDFSPINVSLHKRSDGQFYFIMSSLESQRLYLFNPNTFQFREFFLGQHSDQNKITGFFVQGEKAFVANNRGGVTYLVRLEDDLSYSDLFELQSETESYFRQVIFFDDHFLTSEARAGVIAYSLKGDVLKKFNYEDFGLRSIKNQEVPTLYTPLFFEGYYHFVLNNETSMYKYNSKTMSWARSSFESSDRVNSLNASLPLRKGTLNDDFGNAARFESRDGVLTIKRFFFNSTFEGESAHFAVDDAQIMVSKNLRKELFFSGSGKLYYVMFNNNNVETFLGDHSIRSIVNLKKNNYLVTTENSGFFLIDIDKKTEEPFPLYLNNKPFPISEIRGVFIDKHGIWTNYNEGILFIDPETHKVERFRHFPIRAMVNDGDRLVYGSVKYPLIEFDKVSKRNQPLSKNDSLTMVDLIRFGETFFATTESGLFTFKQGKEGFVDIQVESNKLMMLDVLEDYGLMVTTTDGRVFRLRHENSKPELIFTDPLKSPIVSVFQDAQSNLWFATFSGLIKYNPQTKSLIRYMEDDGFSNNEFNRFSTYQVNEGGVLLGSVRGLNYFETDKLRKLERGGKVVLTGLTYFSTKESTNISVVSFNDLAQVNEVYLPAENKYLKIQVAPKNLLHQPTLDMEYSLNNGEWLGIKESGEIQFNNLAAGKYHLKVRMVDSEGAPFGEAFEMNIYAKEFFYRTIWFALICVLFVIAVSYYFIRQANKEKALEQHYSRSLLKVQEEERIRISRDLHDSVGQQLILLKNQANATQNQALVKNVSDTLEEVRSITRNLHPVVLSRLGLTAALEEMIRQLDENSDIFFSTDLENIDDIFADDEELNLYRIIQEALNNIVKHANAASAKLTIERLKHKVLINIQDNGRGFIVEQEQQSGTSLGLKTLNERIAMLNGKLSIVSKGTGTIISLVIPK
ncbi:ATP-binding protein [Roseivirga ehrenbergii]|uniref:ATP-binding protein n=1 Tax=Roseivirga ehrenbergii (strain DSM 102268 / JCM 13514 / KCTC 12282 / NCIMB 14502 / KMM 6017) TaxID=279360 RepID=UPI001C88B991|nr:sensor histidine kinase [Roseivirga ehrenbergii]